MMKTMYLRLPLEKFPILVVAVILGDYLVEINIPTDPDIETMIRGYFNLPNKTEFKHGYW